ncbi:hypothetical protein HG530_005238 [Fusarium avenaceum]|nr:hypothetical protein HG530_005238 [Fusarium avenaceum]
MTSFADALQLNTRRILPVLPQYRKPIMEIPAPMATVPLVLLQYPRNVVVPAAFVGARLVHSALGIAGSLCTRPLARLGTHVFVQEGVENQLSDLALRGLPLFALWNEYLKQQLHAVIL